MTGYFTKFNENSTRSFRVKDKQLLRNYNKIWEKVENLLNIDFESKPVHQLKQVFPKLVLYIFP